MRTIPASETPGGQGLLILEPGDSIRCDEGEVMVVIEPPPNNPYFTLMTAATDPYTPATPAHHNCMIEGGGQRDR